MTTFVGYTTGDGDIEISDPPTQPVIIQDVKAEVDGLDDITVIITIAEAVTP